MQSKLNLGLSLLPIKNFMYVNMIVWTQSTEQQLIAVIQFIKQRRSAE